MRYDNVGDCADDAKTTCTVPISVSEDMVGSVFVYYELDNFYQNHRTYVKSRSNDQLRGKEMAVADLIDCDPIKKVEDLLDWQQYNLKGVALDK